MIRVGQVITTVVLQLVWQTYYDGNIKLKCYNTIILK